MGDASNQNNRWIDSLTYNHLFEQLEEPTSLLDTIKAILFSGTILKNGTLITDISYIFRFDAVKSHGINCFLYFWQ